MPFLAAIAPTFLLFIIALVGFIVSAIKKSARAIESAWAEAGTRMKLNYQPKKGMSGKRMLEGPYRGYSLRINTFTQSHGNGSSTYTRYTLFMPPLQLGLDLTQQHFLSGLTNALKGGQDLTVGDSDFDKAVIVRSTDPHAMQDFLTPNRRMQIRKFLTETRRGKITDDEITYIENGVAKKAEELRLNSNKLVSLADALQLTPDRDSAQLREEEFRGKAEEKRVTRLDELTPSLDVASTREFFEEEPIMSTVSATPPPSPEQPEPTEVRDPNAPPAFPWQTQTPAAEEQVAEVFETPSEAPLEAPVPIDIPEPVLEEQATPEANAEPEPSPAEAGAFVDYNTMRAELFETSMMSSQAKEHFDANYLGREVKWSGKLRRISGYSSDFTFKEGAGAKAIVELEGIADGSFTKGVQAVVQLPSEAATEFSSRYDIQVEFTGKLHSCDGFLRDIFVEAGSMTAL